MRGLRGLFAWKWGVEGCLGACAEGRTGSGWEGSVWKGLFLDILGPSIVQMTPRALESHLFGPKIKNAQDACRGHYFLKKFSEKRHFFRVNRIE